MSLDRTNASQYYNLDETLKSDESINTSLAAGIGVGTKIKRLSAADPSNGVEAYTVDAFDVDWTGYKIDGAGISTSGEVVEKINAIGSTNATIASGVTLYDESGNQVTADQIVPGATYYTNASKTTTATVGTDYTEPTEFSGIYGVINTAVNNASSGSSSEITSAINALDAEKSGTGTNVTVTVSEVDGKLNSTTVSETYATVTAGTGSLSVTANGGGLVTGNDITKVVTYVDDKVSSTVSGLSSTATSTDGTNINITVNLTDGELASASVDETYATVTSSSSALSSTDGLLQGSDVAKIKTYIDGKAASSVAALDSSTESTGGTNVSITVTETDGKLTASTVSETYATVTAGEGTGSAATLSVSATDNTGLVKGTDITKVITYVNEKVSGAISSASSGLSALESEVDANTSAIETINGSGAGSIAKALLDAKDYTDDNKITVAEGNGIDVTSSGNTFTVAADLVLAYNAASGNNASTITLKNAAGTTTFGTINVSDIVGNGVLKSSSYSATTGVLTLTFSSATGADNDVEVDLSALLDINDVAIASTSQDYLEVSLASTPSSSNETSQQAVFAVKLVDPKDATTTSTGLADSYKVKSYVDSTVSTAVAGKNVSAESTTTGLITASAANNKVTVAAVTTTVSNSSSNALSAGSTTGLLTGAAISTINTSVDNKIEAAIAELDATPSNTGTNVTVGATLADGKITAISVSETYATVSASGSGSGSTLTVATANNSGLVKGTDITKVVNYVDAKVSAASTSASDAIAALDATVNSTGSSNIGLLIVEADGVVTTATITETSSTVTSSTTALSATSGLLHGGDISKIKTYIDGKATSAASSAVSGLESLASSTNGTNVNITVNLASGELTTATVTETYATVTAGEGTGSAATLTVSDTNNSGLVKGTDITKVITYVDEKVSGASSSATTAILALDATVNSTGGTNVSSTLTEVDGVVTGVTISEKYATVTSTDSSLSVSGNTGGLLAGGDIAKIKTYIDGKATSAASSAASSAVAALDSSANSTGGTNVSISVTETDGLLSGATVTETYATVTPGNGTGSDASVTITGGTGLVTGSDLSTIISYVDNKVSGANSSTTTAINALDSSVTSTGGTNVSVSVTEANGLLSAATVTETYATVATSGSGSSATLSVTTPGGLVKGSDLSTVSSFVSSKLTGVLYSSDLSGNTYADISSYFPAIPTITINTAKDKTFTIASTDENAEIYYTLDGTTPTNSNGTLYNGAVTLAFSVAAGETETFTIKAVAYKDTYSSAVATATIENAINFTDSLVESLCVTRFDNDGDGFVNLADAALVTSIGHGFDREEEMTTFDELGYFNNVTSIGYYAFRGCSGLTSITIPSSVTSIDSSAFEGCSGLTSITIPSSVTSIGPNAFNGCTGLTSITIPSSVTSIGEYSFLSCSGLVEISVDVNNTVFDSRNNCNAIIKTSDNTLILGCINTIIPSSVTSIGNAAFGACSGLTSITIPSSVTSIGNAAFAACTGLTSIEIPSSVTSIGPNAFNGCTGLTSVTIKNTSSVISGNSNMFRSVNSNCVIYVPNSLLSEYQSTIDWSTYASMMVGYDPE